MELIVEKVVFDSKRHEDRGFSVRASYLVQPKGDALVEIFRDGQPYRRFLYPAYKVYNIAAHFTDIVDSEIAGNFAGYDIAGWTGFSVVKPEFIPPKEAEVTNGRE